MESIIQINRPPNLEGIHIKWYNNIFNEIIVKSEKLIHL